MEVCFFIPLKGLNLLKKFNVPLTYLNLRSLNQVTQDGFLMRGV